MRDDKSSGSSVPGWRRILAIMLDMVLVFIGFGFAVGWATGGLTPNGFSLSGWPTLLFYALGFAYFAIGWNYAGGTIGDRLLRIPRPRRP